MNETLKQEIQKIIKSENLNCSIEEFQDKVDWNNISYSQKLSEKFIKEFQDKVNWYRISQYQKLLEKFIKEFQNKIDWNTISYSQ